MRGQSTRRTRMKSSCVKSTYGRPAARTHSAARYEYEAPAVYTSCRSHFGMRSSRLSTHATKLTVSSASAWRGSVCSA